MPIFQIAKLAFQHEWDTAGDILLIIVRGGNDFPTTHLGIGSECRGRMAAWAGEDLRLHVWEAKSGRLLFTRTETEPWSMAPLEQPALAFSPGSSELAATGPDGAIRILDAATSELRAKLAGHERHPAALAFSPDGSQLASASYDLTLRIWDRASEKTIHTLRFSRPVQRLAYSPDGRLLAVGLGARTVVEETEPHLEFVDPFSGKVRFRAVTEAMSPGVASLAFDQDGSRLVVMRTSAARYNGEVWDVAGAGCSASSERD